MKYFSGFQATIVNFNMAAEKDLEKFLRDVDEVGSIIKNLSSEDEEKHREAMEASEKFMTFKEDQEETRTNYDKTLVNEQNKCSLQEKQAHNQEQLMKGIELDAKERTDRRKKNEADAEALKSKGNKEFRSGRYQDAIDCYTEAIKLVKYFPALYTNRAQAYIKLENYDDAIDDCNWAIRVDANCVKAYVNCGRALQKKACFSEAISFFRKGQEIDPKQKDDIAGYILQAENEQQKYDFEREVIVKQESNARLKAVGEVIESMGEKKGDLKECSVCVKNLGDLLENNDECKTLFRVSKGFSCFGRGSEFKRLCENCATWEHAEQEMFVCMMLNLAKLAIADNQHNAEEILNHEVIDIIHNLCHKCDVEKVHLASLKLLHQLTEFTVGREHIVYYVKHKRCFLEELLNFLEKQNSISRIVMGCMNNISLDKGFSVKNSLQLQKIVFSVVEKFVTHGHIADNSTLDFKTQLSLVSSSFGTLANLARVKEIRSRLQRNDQVWRLCVNVLSKYIDEVSREEIRELIYSELGLLINLLSEDSADLKNHAMSLTPSLLNMLTSEDVDLLKRALGVLRLLMTYSSEVVQFACTEASFEVLLKIIEGSSDVLTISYGVKCLALCTVRNNDARAYVSANGLALFHTLLSSNNETIVGNSALTFGSCFENGRSGERLVGTSIVKDLLTLATRKDLSVGVKQNVAIALAKLVKQDIRFLDQLRELHGLEILHSVIQSNNLL